MLSVTLSVVIESMDQVMFGLGLQPRDAMEWVVASCMSLCHVQVL